MLSIALSIGLSQLAAYLKGNQAFHGYVSRLGVVEYYCQSGLCIVEYVNGSTTWTFTNHTYQGNLGVGVVLPRTYRFLEATARFCVWNATPPVGIPLRPLGSPGVNGAMSGYSIQLNLWVKAVNGSWYWIQDVVIVTVINGTFLYHPMWCVMRFNGTLMCGGAAGGGLRYPLCGTLSIRYLRNSTLELYLNNTMVASIVLHVGRVGLVDTTLVGARNGQGVLFHRLNATLTLMVSNGTWTDPSLLKWLYSGYWTGEYIVNATAVGRLNSVTITSPG